MGMLEDYGFGPMQKMGMLVEDQIQSTQKMGHARKLSQKACKKWSMPF